MKKTLLLPLLAFTAGSASAAILVSESFATGTYTVGDLTGQNGWSGTDRIEVDAANLSNAGMLGTSGQSMRGVTNFSSDGQGVITAGTVGTDSNSGTGTLWFAGLISMNDTSDDLNMTSILFDSSGGQRVLFGMHENLFVVSYGSAPARNSTPNTTGFVGDQYVGGTTALVVGKLEVTTTASNSDETLDFWFNPTDASSEASLNSTAQGTYLNQSTSVIAGNWGSISLGATMAGSSTNNWFQDEIRVGDNLSDLGLAAVPEPSTYALILGALGLGWVMLRRRS